MSDRPSMAADRERRLNEALAAYLEAAESGRPPDRQAFLAEHPDLADELDEFIKNLSGLTHTRRLRQIPDLAATAVLPALDAAAARAGNRLGDYEILEEIARGGMGVVYRARQVSLNREVALKMILAGQQDAEQSLRRFRLEAEAVARLDHPNIVPIYEVGEIDGQPYFTMKFVEGGSLRTRLDEFELPSAGPEKHLSRSALAKKSAVLVELMAAVARAVHHAHERGILHRDLKPANILLDRQNHPMVTDFGLAKRVEESPDLTRSLVVVGTATYMAPEQAQADKKMLTTTADIYSLGAILYHLLTGRPPFVGDSLMSTLIKVVEEEPIPPALRNPNVPADLEMICLKALTKQPEHRYSTALAMAEDLDRWRAGDIISLRSPTRTKRAWHWAKRNPVSAAMLAAIALLIAVVTIGSSVAAINISAARDRADAKARDAAAAQAEAEKQASVARAARDDAQHALADKERVLVSSYVANGTHALDGGDAFGALLWYGEALHLDQGDTAREEPHRIRLATLLRRSPKLVQVWFGHDASLPPAISADGRRVILFNGNAARVWDVGSGKAISPPFNHSANVERAAFSPDGTRLVTTAADASARVWDATTGHPITPPLKHDKPLTCAAFNRDGTLLVTAGEDHFVRVWYVETGKLRFGLRHSFPVLFAAFSPDGKRLTTCGGAVTDRPRGEIRVWNLEQNPPTSQTLDRLGIIRWAELTADGQSVVAVNIARSAHLWPLAKSNDRIGPNVAAVGLQDLESVVGADPTRVVSLDHSTARIYDLAHNAPVGAPMQHGAEVFLGEFSADGKRIVTAARDRIARVWDAATGAPLTPPLWHGGLVRHARFSGDGSRLITTALDGAVRVWDLPSGEPENGVNLPASSGPTDVSPSGRLLATIDNNGAVLVRDTASGTVQFGPWKLARSVSIVRFAPDDVHLAVASGDGAQVFDFRIGKATTKNLSLAGPVCEISFTPDSSRVAFLGDKNVLQVYRTDNGALQSSLPLPGKGFSNTLVLAPDGNSVAVVFKPKHGLVWRNFAGKVILGPFRHTGVISSAAISPDGSRIAVATSEGAFLWDARGQPAAAPMQPTTPIRQVVFSGNGQLLATLGEDRSVRVWDVQSGQPVTPLLTYRETIDSISLSADAHRLTVNCTAGQKCLHIEDLAPDARPADDLVRLTELLGGHAIDSRSGGFEPIPPALLRTTWPRLREMYPQEFTTKSN